MTPTVTIVAYHYVRDLDASKFPRLKARRTSEFASQVRLISKSYTPITMAEVKAALVDRTLELPPNAALLTFDDGYRDHYTDALPVLADAGVEGTFFVPASPVLEGRVLPVNKIQFTLASIERETDLMDAFFRELDVERVSCDLPANAALLAEHFSPSRWDTSSVAFVKRMLQNVLPFDVRTAIVDRLFASRVTVDEKAFSEELYMNRGQIRELQAEGMHIGGHGVGHVWMDTLDAEEQAAEVEGTRRFLADLGVGFDGWTMCYPYGRWNDPLLALLERSDCWAGFTVECRVAEIGTDGALCLPRVDTNDLPLD
jgi:peptidoglycan/xylan/chitin deacetylase (PgdA/CDA1 family)